MTPEELRQAAMFDIGYWYRWVRQAHGGKCPNCATDFNAVRPEHNLFPHFMGACKTPVVIAEHAPKASAKGWFSRHLLWFK